MIYSMNINSRWFKYLEFIFFRGQPIYV